MAISPETRNFNQVRGAVARILLENACTDHQEKRPLAQRDMASIAGTNWNMVHVSLKSFKDEGVIRIDRNRIIVNEGLLRKIAEDSEAS